MKKITVTRTWIIKEGTGDKGPWALRGVEADDAEGRAISEQLKTFSNLPLGEVDVEVERQDHPQFGVSYLLKPAGGSRRGGAPASHELGELRDRIVRLESEVARLSSLVDRREPDERQLHAVPAAGGIPDDDIPF